MEMDLCPPFYKEDRLLAVDRRQTTVDRRSGRPMLQQRSTVDGRGIKVEAHIQPQNHVFSLSNASLNVYLSVFSFCTKSFEFLEEF